MTLFSRNGYDGVSMRDIASAVGIKAASIYNYFAGKEELLDEIVLEMDRRYQQAGKNIPATAEEAAIFFSQITTASLVYMASELFLYFLQDEYASRFRRLVTMEQFRNPRVLQVFLSHFIHDPLHFQAGLFQVLIQQGKFKPADSEIAALQFYAPIFLLLNQYDSTNDPSIALDALRRHVEQFAMLYSIQ